MGFQKKNWQFGAGIKVGFNSFPLPKSSIINPSVNQLIFSLSSTFSVLPVKVEGIQTHHHNKDVFNSPAGLSCSYLAYFHSQNGSFLTVSARNTLLLFALSCHLVSAKQYLIENVPCTTDFSIPCFFPLQLFRASEIILILLKFLSPKYDFYSPLCTFSF